MKALDIGTRIQLKNVLFATDFSPAADAAIPYAIELAKHYGAKLYAFHARSPVIDALTPMESWNALEEAAKVQAEQQRRELLKAFGGMKPEILIPAGDLWSTLAAAIEGNRIDLIVMGTRGRSGIRKFLLGSAAEAIFRQAACPVLTVGPLSPTKPRHDGEFTKILFPTDFSQESLAAAPYALSLSQEYQAYLTLMHVVEELRTGELVHPAELVPSSERLLHNIVPAEAELWCVPNYVVECGPVDKKILEVAASQRTDLIVLGVRQATGFQGAAAHLPTATAHSVVSRAECPVLTVRG
ncbi:MAG: universal stress protein [Candidatus Acidiferrales bacterium]